MKNICFPSQEDWDSMTEKEKEDFNYSLNDLRKFAKQKAKENKLLEKISSQKLLQELIRRKDLIRAPKTWEKEYILRKPYQQGGTRYKEMYLLRKRGEENAN